MRSACRRLDRAIGLAAALVLAAGPRPLVAQMAVDKGTIVAGPFRLGYRIEGTGWPAIVIGSSLYYPRVFSRDLRKHLRLVFLDHRGFTASPGPVDRSQFALDVLIDDVERARQQLGLDRVVVIGHSGHAYMALEYAKKHREHVSHVVLIGISPDLSAASREEAERYWNESVWPERKAALQENVRALPDAELAKLSGRELFVRGYVRDGPRSWFDPRFDSTPLWKGVEVNMDMFDYVWGEVFRDIDITRGLESLDRPVLLALGRYDFLVAPPSSWDRVRPKFRDLTVRVFERSGHTPQHDEAALFDAELLRWIAEHR
jgi:proline iminopeptidase